MSDEQKLYGEVCRAAQGVVMCCLVSASVFDSYSCFSALLSYCQDVILLQC